MRADANRGTRAGLRPDRPDTRRPARRSPLLVHLGVRAAGEADFAVLALLLVLVALGGGSAFADTLSLLYVRPAAVAAFAAFLLIPPRPGITPGWNGLRAPLWMLVALAAIIAAQLVPLPPAIWTFLPGRQPYLEAAAAAGLAQPWRPLSLTPDLTANSLAALVVPAAVLAGFAKLSPRQRARLLPGFILLCAASMAFGVMQFAGGGQSALYWYKRTYQGTTTGLLANRNHQAAMLAALFPALRAWTLMPAATRQWDRQRRWLALALGIVAIPVILATGSRAGLVLGLAGLTAAWAMFPTARQTNGAGSRFLPPWLLRFGVPVLLAGLVAATLFLGRALSVQRLTGTASDSLALSEDLRFRLAPAVVRLIRGFFPTGSGFGSFDPVFRQYEPDAVLISSYFNHAHNEPLEVAVTAGLPGLILLGVFMTWWAARSWEAWRARSRGDGDRLALLGGVVIGVLMAASLVDYPLRTPLLEAWFALACGWLCTRRLDRENPAVPAAIAAAGRPL